MNVKSDHGHILNQYVHQIQLEGWGLNERGHETWPILTKKPWPLNPELAQECWNRKNGACTWKTQTEMALQAVEDKKDQDVDKLDCMTFE